MFELARPALSEVDGAVDCRRCVELVSSRRRIVYPTKCQPGGLVAIGEAPGASEDIDGEGFTGTAGRVLDSLLLQNGLERNRDYGVANLVRCRPHKNRRPSASEINNCLAKLAGFLVEARPRVLLLVGGEASKAFLGHGLLSWHIERARRSPILLARYAHRALQDAIRDLHRGGAVYAVPMPHTSGMAWNRNAPGGVPWRDIGARQVEFAAALWKKEVLDDADRIQV